MHIHRHTQIHTQRETHTHTCTLTASELLSSVTAVGTPALSCSISQGLHWIFAIKAKLCDLQKAPAPLWVTPSSSLRAVTLRIIEKWLNTTLPPISQTRPLRSWPVPRLGSLEPRCKPDSLVSGVPYPQVTSPLPSRPPHPSAEPPGCQSSTFQQAGRGR